MESDVQFTFRNKEYSCYAVMDCSEYPYYIFTILADNELITEFGDEVTIKTNGEGRLPKRDDLPVLTELREAIFDGVKTTPEFIALKETMAGYLPGGQSFGKFRKLNYKIIQFKKLVIST